MTRPLMIALAAIVALSLALLVAVFLSRPAGVGMIESGRLQPAADASVAA
jgi:preprotein translocase subunit SecG